MKIYVAWRSNLLAQLLPFFSGVSPMQSFFVFARTNQGVSNVFESPILDQGWADVQASSTQLFNSCGFAIEEEKFALMVTLHNLSS